MAALLMERLQGLGSVENLGERTNGKDLYILGGGTLIAPHSLFLRNIVNPHKTIGFSLGVSSNWNGEYAKVLKECKRLYVRDKFSHRRLADHGIESTLSVDMLCALMPSATPDKRDQVTWNAIKGRGKTRPEGVTRVVPVSVEDEGEDPVLKGQELVDLMAKTKRAYCMRLHAVVCAWVAGVPDIFPYTDYDPKVWHFFERVEGMTPEEARHIIDQHFEELMALCLR